MMESEAWRALNLPARKLIDRLLIEHMAHAGTQNGNLVVLYDDFAAFGIRRQSVKGAIDLAVSLGFVKVIIEGGRKKPSIYALTWLPTGESPPVNTWKRVSRSLSDTTQDIKRGCKSAPSNSAKNERSKDVVVSFPHPVRNKSAPGKSGL